MDTNHDGVRHIGPEGGIAHGDVTDAACESLACGIGCSAVVGIAAEDAVVEDIGASSENIESIAPLGEGNALHIM